MTREIYHNRSHNETILFRYCGQFKPISLFFKAPKQYWEPPYSEGTKKKEVFPPHHARHRVSTTCSFTPPQLLMCCVKINGSVFVRNLRQQKRLNSALWNTSNLGKGLIYLIYRLRPSESGNDRVSQAITKLRRAPPP